MKYIEDLIQDLVNQLTEAGKIDSDIIRPYFETCYKAGLNESREKEDTTT